MCRGAKLFFQDCLLEAGSLRVSFRSYFFGPFLARKGARGMVEWVFNTLLGDHVGNVARLVQRTFLEPAHPEG